MSRMRFGVERRGWAVYVAIFAPLVLLIGVAVMTWRAEQRYEAVTRRVIHDYAAIAAWQFARRAGNALHDEAMHAMAGIAAGHRRVGPEDLLDPALIIAARSDTATPLLAHARFAFSYDGVSGRLRIAGIEPDSTFRARLVVRLDSALRSMVPGVDPHHVLFDDSGGELHAIGLWTIAAIDAPPRGTYGVVADAAALRPTFLEVLAQSDLLPTPGAGVHPTERDLAVRLTRPDGDLVFATDPPVGVTAATDSTGCQHGELHATVDIPPQLAGTLLVGGRPRSQLPTLALMIVVAGALAVLGVRYERRARELARARTGFIAGVSHELRTPLAQISMFAETLALGRERSDQERRHFASIVLAEARRLAALVESVLRFSRGETGRRPLRTEPVNLRAEIRQASEAFAPIASAADARVELDLAGPAVALVDRAAFRQIMLNLLDNAVKHGGRGTLVRVATGEEDGTVAVVVDDSGVGIPPASREKVFEPYVRLNGERGTGVGIGLSVVRDLVIAQSGRIHIDDSPLGGARFVVTLPAAPIAAPAAEHAPVGA